MESFRTRRKGKEIASMIRYCVEDLKKYRVNMDKKLKRTDLKKVALSYAEALVYFKGILYTMMRKMNDLTMCDDSDTQEFEFNSSYWGPTMKPENMKSYVYRCRFLTAFYLEIFNHLDEFIEAEYLFKGSRQRPYEDRYDILFEIIDTVTEFTGNFISGKAVMEDIPKIFETFTLKKPEKVKKQKRQLKIMNKQLNVIKDSQVKIPVLSFLEMPMEDSRIINNLTKLAYMISTDDLEVTKTGQTQEGLTFADESEVSHIIERMGRQILKYRRKHKIPILYRIFWESMPEESFKYRDCAINENLEEGCRALYYLRFVSGSKEIENLIDQMI